MIFNLLEKFMRELPLCSRNKAQENDILEKLCNSKTKYQDKLVLSEYSEIESLKLSLVKKMILGIDLCLGIKESTLSEAINQFSHEDVENLDLGVACILEFSKNKEEQELILRNRMEKKKLLKYLNLIESPESIDGDPQDPEDSVDVGQKEDEDMTSPSTQIKIKTQLASSDPNQIVFALEKLLFEIGKKGSIDVIRDICKEKVGSIFAKNLQDPLIITLIFEVIIKLGIDKKNERAVVGKLEQFAMDWPLEARALVELLIGDVDDENLTGRLKELRVERLQGDPLVLEDIIPAYLLADNEQVNEKQTDEGENIFQ